MSRSGRPGIPVFQDFGEGLESVETQTGDILECRFESGAGFGATRECAPGNTCIADLELSRSSARGTGTEAALRPIAIDLRKFRRFSVSSMAGYLSLPRCFAFPGVLESSLIVLRRRIAKNLAIVNRKSSIHFDFPTDRLIPCRSPKRRRHCGKWPARISRAVAAAASNEPDGMASREFFGATKRTFSQFSEMGEVDGKLPVNGETG